MGRQQHGRSRGRQDYWVGAGSCRMSRCVLGWLQWRFCAATSDASCEPQKLSQSGGGYIKVAAYFNFLGGLRQALRRGCSGAVISTIMVQVGCPQVWMRSGSLVRHSQHENKKRPNLFLTWDRYASKTDYVGALSARA